MSGFVEKPEPIQVPGLVHLHTGKVRELYQNEAGDLVMVASDRMSAYDWVLPTEIPDKGRILTQLSLWWFDRLADLVPNHVLSTELPAGAPADWAGRTLICKSLQMVPVECVALVQTLYRWGARNCEIHFAQVRGEYRSASGVVMPTFMPETA